MSDYEEERNRKDWMSEDQWECAIFLRDLFYGFNHVFGEIKEAGTGIVINTRNTNWAATYDYDGLTRAVLMSHERMIRFDISSSRPGMLKLRLCKRHKREGAMNERHPTIEDAISKFKSDSAPQGEC